MAVDNTASGRVGRQAPHTGATLLSGVGHGATTCCYCQKPHLSKDCRIVTHPGARKQILLKAGRCFVCLHTGHVSKDCRSKSKCTSAVEGITCLFVREMVEELLAMAKRQRREPEQVEEEKLARNERLCPVDQICLG